ncbi:hypothetical protein BV25DRAFT_1891647 [Artomyces pyxidatus]|uniref:Uncharacterized protein n=1 Tax=Artomyces pyxidatus TaxID=48021 RepID=A0ACB8SPM7_9AGAM|nr:hypothetical protein BV25DRAFT_1891647 [Artomyces pyxidatus]
MSQWMSVTFLGTSSGGGPSETRNCSSLVLDVVGNGSLWMVDCAEGTLRQFVLQPSRLNNQRAPLKVSRVDNIFITHMHADHVMGLITLLRNVLGILYPDSPVSLTRAPKVNIYGPAGLRAFVRSNLSLTHTRTADGYAVHELLVPTDARTPCEPAEVLHPSERRGRDLLCDQDGFWRDITIVKSQRGEIRVQAGPIIHRDPCIGYVMHEPELVVSSPYPRQPRKLVVLGDTSSASALTPLVTSTPGRVSLLIHEATDAFIPAHVDSQLAAKRSQAVVKSKTDEHGHSTPVQAGECAGLWGAERLILNHIGGRFHVPLHASQHFLKHRHGILREMEWQATEAWRRAATASASTSGGLSASRQLSPKEISELKTFAAYDFFTMDIPAQPLMAPDPQAGTNAETFIASEGGLQTVGSMPILKRRRT